MNVEVVTVSSRVPTASYYHYDVFLKSLERLGVVPTILNGATGYTKLAFIIAWLTTRSAPQRITCLKPLTNMIGRLRLR